MDHLDTPRPQKRTCPGNELSEDAFTCDRDSTWTGQAYSPPAPHDGQHGGRRDTIHELQGTIDPRILHFDPLMFPDPSGTFWKAVHLHSETPNLKSISSETNTLPNVASEHSFISDTSTGPESIPSHTLRHSKAAADNADPNFLLRVQYQPVPRSSHGERHMGEDQRDTDQRTHELAEKRGKRNLDLIEPVSADEDTKQMHSSKMARLEHGSVKVVQQSYGDTASQGLHAPSVTTHTTYSPIYSTTPTYELSGKQKAFIHEWLQAFPPDLQDSIPPNESIKALATLVQSSPQPIREYFNANYDSRQRTKSTSEQPTASPLSATDQSNPHRQNYTFRDANHRLDPHTLTLVEKYVSSCRRRRAKTDGRRSVNEGPLMCTYGCGYRTKRAFDWKRHEETHEPQELWLCHLCCQNEEPNPFLVNRKDKFLRHVKDTHKKWEPETVLEMSKVDFQADFNSRCHLCPEVSKTWDDRCRHLLLHFEDGAQREARKGRLGGSAEGRKGRPAELERDTGGTATRPPSSDSNSDHSSVGPGSVAESEKDPG